MKTNQKAQQKKHINHNEKTTRTQKERYRNGGQDDPNHQKTKFLQETLVTPMTKTIWGKD